jgi:aconitate hydratase
MGVGGIEAEGRCSASRFHAAAGGAGFPLHGKMQEGCTATDLVLTVTQILARICNGKFVEFFEAA